MPRRIPEETKQRAIRLVLNHRDEYANLTEACVKIGGQLGIGLLVGLMDISTANNTVAIVMANPIATEMAKDYGISPRKTASILDTFSCIFQGILPYGAQMLVALSVVSTMGFELTAFDVISNLFYPMMLLLSSLVFIFFVPEKEKKA